MKPVTQAIFILSALLLAIISGTVTQDANVAFGCYCCIVITWIFLRVHET